MNEYDDLFKKPEQIRETSQKPFHSLDPNEEMQKNISEQKINRIIFISYFIIAILMSIVSYSFFYFKYPDAATINSNLSIASAPAMTYAESGDEIYPYNITLTGSIANGNDFELPCIFIIYNIYGTDNNLIASQYINQEKVSAGGVFTYEETISSEFEPSYFAYSYGFDESSYFYIIIFLLQLTLSAILFLYIDKVAFVSDFKRFFSNFWNSSGLVVGGIFALITMMYVSQIILSNFFNVYTTSENEMTINSMFAPDPFRLFLLFMILCVLTPIVEELTFRKALYGFFYRRLGPVVAIIASSLVFGLLHVASYGDFIQAIVYVPMGAVLGIFYYLSKRNVHVTIGIHFINNFISFLIYAFAAYGVTLFA